MTTNCDPRIRAVENLLDALSKCEDACGDFDSGTVIHSANVAAVLLLIGGTVDKDNGAMVTAEHKSGAEISADPVTYVQKMDADDARRRRVKRLLKDYDIAHDNVRAIGKACGFSSENAGLSAAYTAMFGIEAAILDEVAP